MDKGITKLFEAALAQINRQRKTSFTLLGSPQTADGVNYEFSVGCDELKEVQLTTIHLPLIDLDVDRPLPENKINEITEKLLLAQRTKLYAKEQAAGEI